MAPARPRSPSASRNSYAPASGAGDTEAAREVPDLLAPLVVVRLGDGDAAVREAAKRFLVFLMEMFQATSTTAMPFHHFTTATSLLPGNKG